MPLRSLEKVSKGGPLPLSCKISGFTTVALEELKNGAHLDRRVYKDVVSIDSSFGGVLSAILRQKCSKPGDRDPYSSLVSIK